MRTGDPLYFAKRRQRFGFERFIAQTRRIYEGAFVSSRVTHSSADHDHVSLKQKTFLLQRASQCTSYFDFSSLAQVPYLVDPNTGRSMGESQDIISYLFATYGVKN